MTADLEGDISHALQDSTMSADDISDWDCAGLEAIDRACSEIYPDQPNPLQATAVVKMWLGGPDPLDYISIYSNSGNIDRGIPPHWHYVSYGFSDLYGDGRIHPIAGSTQPSGFGFELTLRLKKNDGDTTPPMWPSGLMNRLASYVYQTGNNLHIGDHIPWHKPLDGGQVSCIQHMLVTEDPQLSTLQTAFGVLDFRQIVGVTDDEMKAAQKWKGAGVLELMQGTKEVGPFFITDIERSSSIFEMDPNLNHLVTEGINNDGSNLGHVTAVCLWSNLSAGTGCMKQEGDEETGMEEDTGEGELETLEGIHLMFDAEAADLLPMVVRARLQKGRFFVFHNAENHAIHLIPPDFHEEGIHANQSEPLKSKGTYLQVYCSNELLERMAQEFDTVLDHKEENEQYPKEFRFSDPTILITVSPRGQLHGADRPF